MKMETEYCPVCAGSGEGSSDGSFCSNCGGKGEIVSRPKTELFNSDQIPVSVNALSQARKALEDAEQHLCEVGDADTLAKQFAIAAVEYARHNLALEERKLWHQ